MKTTNTLAIITLCALTLITTTHYHKNYKRMQINVPIPTLHDLYDTTPTPDVIDVGGLC